MHNYVEPRAARQTSGDDCAPKHRTDAHIAVLSTVSERAVAEPLNESPRVQSLLQMRHALDDGPSVQSQLALQRALNQPVAAQVAALPGAKRRKLLPVQRKPNATGLPDKLKAGVEHLAGLAMDDVRVHYNSPKPATVQAHAYAQGTDIHLGPGQEQHLPHEAWHVVQQKQGRVKPTLQMKGVAINDDAGLEREADVLGARALQQTPLGSLSSTTPGFLIADHEGRGSASAQRWPRGKFVPHHEVIQRLIINLDPSDPVITDAANIAKQRDDAVTKGNARMISEGKETSGEAAPLALLGPEEEIEILAHGTPAFGNAPPKVAGRTAAELYAFLVRLGFSAAHTGIINLSNCTSAWDRKSTGSFASQFVAILESHGHSNFVLGFESFTETADVKTEREISPEHRETYLAHKTADRYLNALHKFSATDSPDKIKETRELLAEGAKQAKQEASDLAARNDPESMKLVGFYAGLAGLLKLYLSDLEAAGDQHNQARIFAFQEDAQSLMVKYDIDKIGGRVARVEAIPVVMVTKPSSEEKNRSNNA